MKRCSHWSPIVLLPFLALSLDACTNELAPLGQLMVSVETDAPLPDYVDGIRLQIFQESIGREPVLLFDRQPEVLVGPGQLLIPATVAVVAGKRPDDLVRVRLLARKYGYPRILREAITQVPTNRIAVLHIVIEWLCDGSAVEGDPMYCSDPSLTCSGGRCVPKWIDPATLPTYGGQAGDGGAQEPDRCFDVPLCFSAATPAVINQASCSIARPEGDLATTNLALVAGVGTGGECLPGGPCLVSLTRGPLGWVESPDGQALLLPPSVCASASKRIKGVVVSRLCASKVVGMPLCGAWAPSAQPGGDAGVQAGDAAAPPLACATSAQCPSGFCIDGFCCNEACNGACTTCAAPGSEGVCTPAVAGVKDPRGLCVASAPLSCGYDGNCGPQGACAYWRDGTVCENVAVANKNVATCGGIGLCLLPNGRDCAAHTQCRSGFCADNVCSAPTSMLFTLLSAVTPLRSTMGASFTLTATVANVPPTWVLNWNGQALATSVVSPGLVQAKVPSPATLTQGLSAVWFADPANSSSHTNVLYVSIAPAPGAPILIDYSPDNALPGATINIVGANLTTGRVVLKDGNGTVIEAIGAGAITWMGISRETLRFVVPVGMPSGPLTVSNGLGTYRGKIFNVGQNLSRVEGAVAMGSTQFNIAQWSQASGADNNLQTSWFTATGDCASNPACTSKPWFQITFSSPQTIGRLALRGNREYANGYDFLSGMLAIYGPNNAVLWSTTVVLPEPDRDIDLSLPKPVAGALSVRFSSLSDEGSGPGLAELQLFGP